MNRRFFLATVLLATLVGVFCSRAAIIAQWNFNSVPPDGTSTTGTNVPSIGFGTASAVGGITTSFSEGSTNDPSAQSEDSGWSSTHYPAQGESNKTAGVQFNVGTLGYSNIVIRWDQRVSS